MSRVCVVVALMPEAKPLIESWGLSPILLDGPYSCFGNDDLALIVSGLGSDLAAAACGYLYGALDEKPAGWLNVGIGGHADLPLGTLRLADQVVDLRGGVSFPMRLAGLPDLQTAKYIIFSSGAPVPRRDGVRHGIGRFCGRLPSAHGPRGHCGLKSGVR